MSRTSYIENDDWIANQLALVGQQGMPKASPPLVKKLEEKKYIIGVNVKLKAGPGKPMKRYGLSEEGMKFLRDHEAQKKEAEKRSKNEQKARQAKDTETDINVSETQAATILASVNKKALEEVVNTILSERKMSDDNREDEKTKLLDLLAQKLGEKVPELLTSSRTIVRKGRGRARGTVRMKIGDVTPNGTKH